jgi:hypothetical protein
MPLPLESAGMRSPSLLVSDWGGTVEGEAGDGANLALHWIESPHKFHGNGAATVLQDVLEPSRGRGASTMGMEISDLVGAVAAGNGPAAASAGAPRPCR